MWEISWEAQASSGGEIVEIIHNGIISIIIYFPPVGDLATASEVRWGNARVKMITSIFLLSKPLQMSSSRNLTLWKFQKFKKSTIFTAASLGQPNTDKKCWVFKMIIFNSLYLCVVVTQAWWNTRTLNNSNNTNVIRHGRVWQVNTRQQQQWLISLNYNSFWWKIKFILSHTTSNRNNNSSINGPLIS